MPSSLGGTVAGRVAVQVPHRGRVGTGFHHRPTGTEPSCWKVAVRDGRLLRGLARLHQVQGPPRRVHPGLSRTGHSRRGAHLRGGRGQEISTPTPLADKGAGRRPFPAPHPGHRHSPLRKGRPLPLPPGTAGPRLPRPPRQPRRRTEQTPSGTPGPTPGTTPPIRHRQLPGNRHQFPGTARHRTHLQPVRRVPPTVQRCAHLRSAISQEPRHGKASTTDALVVSPGVAADPCIESSPRRRPPCATGP